MKSKKISVTKSMLSGVTSCVKRKFIKFHKENPGVVREFHAFAELAYKSRKRYSAKAIMERLRWSYDIDVQGEQFKINNSYTSCYARVLIANRKKFKKFFATRG